MGRKVSPIRMASSEYAPRTPLDVFEDFYRFDDVAPGGIVISVQALCISIPEIESQIMLDTKRASCVRYGFAHDWLGFSVAL